MTTIRIFKDNTKKELLAEVSSFSALVQLDRATGLKLQPNQILVNGEDMEDLPTVRARFKDSKNLPLSILLQIYEQSPSDELSELIEALRDKEIESTGIYLSGDKK